MQDFISNNRTLNQKEMEHNARLIAITLHRAGFTIQAIAAMLGNMQSESTINPGRKEDVDFDEQLEKDPDWVYDWREWGLGLTQWTPGTKLIDFADSKGKAWDDGYLQCERLIYERDNNIQWFSNPSAPIVNPPLTFFQFSKSKINVKTLANYFLWYYEHPAETIQPIRAEQAFLWFQFVKALHLDKNFIYFLEREERKMEKWQF